MNPGILVPMDGTDLVKVEVGAKTEAFKWLTDNGFLAMHQRGARLHGIDVTVATFEVPYSVREEMLQTVR